MTYLARISETTANAACLSVRLGLWTGGTGHPIDASSRMVACSFKLIPPIMTRKYRFCADRALRNVDSRVNFALRYRI